MCRGPVSVLARPPSTLSELEWMCIRLHNLGSYREAGSPGPSVGLSEMIGVFGVIGRVIWLGNVKYLGGGQVMGDRESE